METEKYPSQVAPKFMLRYTQVDRDWLKRQAKRNGSSQNSEIIRAIRERRERIERGEVA
jgi:predicted HicB family RNase H-like nuclease